MNIEEAQVGRQIDIEDAQIDIEKDQIYRLLDIEKAQRNRY